MTKIKKLDAIMKKYSDNHERIAWDRYAVNLKIDNLAYGESEGSRIMDLVRYAKKMVYVINREIPPNE